MRVIILTLIMVYHIGIHGFAQRYWVASESSNWNNAANWSATSGGAGGASVPTAGEPVFFNASGNGNCILDLNVVVNGLSTNGYMGGIDLNGFDLTTTGVNLFATGTIMNSLGTGSLLFNTIGSSTFSGTVFNTEVTGASGRIFFNGSQFNNSLNLTKTSGNNDTSAGGNLFNGPVVITTTGGGITLGNVNADQFNNTVTFNNLGTYRFILAHGHSNQTTTFAMDVVLHAAKTGGADTWAFQIAEGNSTHVTFANDLLINCTGLLNSSYRFLNGSGSTAIYMGAVTIDITNSNTGTIIFMGANGQSNYNDNIVVDNGTGGVDVIFNFSSTASSTLADGRTISLGTSGFVSGELRLSRFHQVGSTNQILLLTEDAILTIGPNSVFEANVEFRSPRLNLDGCHYMGTAILEKTSLSSDSGDGGNLFNSTVHLINSGSGTLTTANLAPDIFNGELTITSTGTGNIRLAHNVSGNAFNGNVIINSENDSRVYFSTGTNGSATLASGRTFSLGTFHSSELIINALVQTDNTPFTLNLAGNSILRVGRSTVFNGNIDLRAARVYLNGISVDGTAYIEKFGAGNDTGLGGNTFSSTTTIVNSGAGDFSLGNTLADIFTGDLIASNTGSARILLANNSANNMFGGNVMVNSTSGSGIYFCNGASGSATLTNGQIQIGVLGFSSGELRLTRITQGGSVNQDITLSGNAVLRCGAQSVWSGNVTFAAPSIFLNGTTFNGSTTSITKTGSGTNSSAGGNTFASATTTITNSGTGTFRLANITNDTFNGHITFSVSSGAIQPAFNSTSLFTGNITVNNTVAITFGAGTGTVLFGGSSEQSVNQTGTAAITFRRFTMDKMAGNVTLNTPVNVSLLGTFTNGNVITTSTNLLNFSDGAVTSDASNASYIDGPVRKTGNEAFSFPTGDNGVYRPIAISAPSTDSHHFTAQYFNINQVYGLAMAAGIQNISGCEYWTLDRTNGNSNVAVTMNWNSADCLGEYINDVSDLRVVRWNGTAWANHGNGGTTGDGDAGSVTSDGVITSFSPFTIGSSSLDNPLPVELTSFSAQQLQHSVLLQWTTASELNNDYFTLEKSRNGLDFENLTTIKGAGTSVKQQQYQFIDKVPFKYKTYYRLKQTDFDGQYSYSKIIVVYQQIENQLEVYPNPATSTKLLEVNKMGRFVVFNNLGVIVLRATDTDQIDISKLATGVYVVKSDAGEMVRLVVH